MRVRGRGGVEAMKTEVCAHRSQFLMVGVLRGSGLRPASV